MPVINLRDAEFERDPRAVLAEALAKGPVAKSRRGFEFLSYALISEAFLSGKLDTAGPDHYTRLGAGGAVLWFVDNGLLSTMSRARHDPIRRLMLKAFSFRQVDSSAPRRGRPPRSSSRSGSGTAGVELIGQLTEYYPIRVMSRMIGIPQEDIPRFACGRPRAAPARRRADGPRIPPPGGRARRADRLVRGLIAQRRAYPREDDFITTLLAAQADEGRISEDELVGNLVNLVFAGMGTTTKQLASAVHDIVPNDLWERLHQRPADLQATINECLRFSPVTQFVVRIAQEDADSAASATHGGRGSS